MVVDEDPAVSRPDVDGETKRLAAALADAALAVWEAGRKAIAGASPAAVADEVEARAVDLSALAAELREWT